MSGLEERVIALEAQLAEALRRIAEMEGRRSPVGAAPGGRQVYDPREIDDGQLGQNCSFARDLGSIVGSRF